MGANNMLTIPLYLEVQPGLGSKPVLYLKENMQSVRVDLFVVERGHLTGDYGRACVIKGTLPDKSRLYIKSSTTGDWGRLKITLWTRDVRKMVTAPGTYECTVTILNASSSEVTEQNHMNFDTVSMLPFTVVVGRAPGRDGNA